ncbi:methyl-accepting chemotaxis protein [Effusibacillus consociatus]|uniref:Methyl-accepting chemotaxis protein n=1 Tax=Effusibacillus consociatus TaxID=1117041 RepID=A0ABV9Q1S9_9BACL
MLSIIAHAFGRMFHMFEHGMLANWREQSGESAQQIAELIKEVQTDTLQSVGKMDRVKTNVQSRPDVVEEAKESFNRILTVSQQVAERVQEISLASEQLHAGAGHVIQSFDLMARIAKVSADSTQKIAFVSGD